MTAEHEGDVLQSLEAGDVIRVSERHTPMEVVKTEKTPSGKGVEVKAENHHGVYYIRKYGDEPPFLRAGGDKRIVGNVGVTRVE